MDNVRQFLEQDKFAAHVGIELLEITEGRARARLELAACHLNGAGSAHGGAIFALADLVFGAASNSHGTVAVGINVSIAYVKAVSSGVLYAEATEVSANPRLATYAVKVTDTDGDVVAIFQGMVYRKKTPLPVTRLEATPKSVLQ